MNETPTATILVVEDDDQVRAFIRALLSSEGYRVLEASTGAEAVTCAEEHDAEIDLLISDMLLPELSGYDVALKLRAQHPTMKILFMTGYVEGEIVQRCLSELGADFLDKPFAPNVLTQRVRSVLSSGVSETRLQSAPGS